MVTISGSKKQLFGRYTSSQLRYAAAYVIITFVVLLILNLYCSQISQILFYKSKQTSMIEKCQLASDEISTLEVMNTSTITSLLSQMESLKATRLVITDQSAAVLYDSVQTGVGRYALLPEILRALEGNRTEVSRGPARISTWKLRFGRAAAGDFSPCDDG